MELFKRTGSEDFPSNLKMMISGPPKSGKTSLLGTVPNIVIADTEPHANNLQSIAHKNVPYVTIKGSDDLQRLLFVLRDETFREKAAAQLGMPAIEAVAIDTLDTLQAIMKKERMRATGKDFLRDDWGWIKEEMTSILQAFTALPMHVFFCVHTKTKEIGKGDDVRTIVLPGLEGSIAESVAGMVGYSLLSFRKEEIRPDGSKYTKYWLKTEGDETYDFLGTRTAGRLPDIIEPDFSTILAAALAGRPTTQPAPVQIEIQTTQAQVSATVTGTAAPSGPTSFVPGQHTTGPAGPTVQVTNPEQQTPAVQQAQVQGLPPGDDEPVNAAALMHVKKVYDALGLAFPEQIILSLQLGQARQIVQAWRAALADASQGKGGDPQAVTRDYLVSMGWIDPADAAATPIQRAPAEQPAPTSLDEANTIPAVLAWAREDLERIQAAHDIEVAKDRPRSSLVETLVRKGAKPAPQSAPVPPQAAEQAAAPVETSPQPPVTPTPPEPAEPQAAASGASEPATVEEAVSNVQQAMNGQVVGDEITADSKCSECGNTIDDLDIAKLSDARYHKVLCVNDYIAETKKIPVG